MGKRTVKPIVCLLCGEKFLSITASHLDVHNVSVEDYKKNYGPLTAQEMYDRAMKQYSRSEILQKAIDDLNEDESTDITATEVLRVVKRNLGDKVVKAALTTVQARLSNLFACEEILARVILEFQEPWRLKQHDDGSPVTLKELLHVAEMAHVHINSSTNAILSLLQSVIQDNKSVVARPQVVSGTVFSGTEDNVPRLPQDSSERETIRLLYEKFMLRLSDVLKEGRIPIIDAAALNPPQEDHNGQNRE